VLTWLGRIVKVELGMSKAQLQELQARFAAGRPNLDPSDLGAMRQGFEDMLTQFPVAPGVTFEQVDLDGIPARWCVPAGARQGRMLLYLHGGGYMVGNSKAYGPLASELASRLKVRVLIPDYRLAPENPYPAALDDAVKVYRWLLGHSVPAPSIAVAGDSCGGGLTVAALAAIRDAGLPLPAGAAIISPWADMEVSSESFVGKAGEDQLLNVDGLRGMAGAYLGGAPPRTPGASPVYANLAGLPPLLIQVGSTEVLLDDSTRLAARAGAAGVKVRLDVWPEMFHVWHAYASMLDEAGEALDDAAEFIDRLFATQKTQLSAGAPA
jgi:acetyl esterase/lipase